MPQGAWFANESLRATITGGRPGDLDAALDAAAVGPVIAALPPGPRHAAGRTRGRPVGRRGAPRGAGRALYGTPDVILADEPTADLDADTAAAVTAGLLAQAARGATLIVATHDPALAARMGRTVPLGQGSEAA
jgi:ATP-binding cassette subfamily C protein CydD